MNKGAPSLNGGDSERLRRLQPHERVSHGDFVADDRNGFELWSGPSGFRADSFIKPIYRKESSHSIPIKIKTAPP